MINTKCVTVGTMKVTTMMFAAASSQGDEEGILLPVDSSGRERRATILLRWQAQLKIK